MSTRPRPARCSAANAAGQLIPRLLDRRAHGVIVAVPIPADLDRVALCADLSAEERALQAPFGDKRARTFAAGRRALRAALSEAGVDVEGPILQTPRGAPLVPVGVLASVSHKDELAIAIACVDDGSGAQLGVDVELFDDLARQARERSGAKRMDLSRHVLTEHERAELAQLDDEARHRGLLLRFSLKESLYKALDPFVQRYVGFLEVQARPNDDGTASFLLALTHGEGPFVIDGAWAVIDAPLPGVVTSVRVRRM